jgi:hypothetical protein
MSPLIVDAVLGRQVEEVFLDTTTPPLTGYQSV